MLRFVSGRALAVLLGLGGLAMAQDGLIVDPWQRLVSVLAAPQATAPVANDRTAARPVGTASSPIAAPKAGPAVVPLGPPLAADAQAVGVFPIGAITSPDVVDPWVGSAPSGRASAEHPTAPHSGHADWAHAIDEIVDPWKRGPLAVFTDPIIVDPWAR